MFANRRQAFRSLEVLATAFDDEPPYTLTRATLRRLRSETVRRNTGTRDSWVKANNWDWQIDEQTRRRSIAKDASGLYILAEDVPEGFI